MLGGREAFGISSNFGMHSQVVTSEQAERIVISVKYVKSMITVEPVIPPCSGIYKTKIQIREWKADTVNLLS